jgi:CheY-like chemotaxis protein
MEILRRLGPGDEQRRWSQEVIGRQLQHLSRLTDELQDLEIRSDTLESLSEGRRRGSTMAVRPPVENGLHPPTPGEETRGAETSGLVRRILVVDDSADHADSLALVLRLSGHDVRTAYDGASALAAAEAWQPDVVLLNPDLPRLSGLEVARRLRTDLDRKEVLLVAMSEWAQAEDRRRIQEAGFHAHLIKPVKLHTLRALLAEPLPPGS